LHSQLENGLIKQDGNRPRFVIFGDNAYLNTLYMVTSFPNVSGDPNQVSEDSYSFYHSQLCIWIKCAFGITVQRWGMLQTAMPQNLSISKIVALVNVLAKLHNFCINDMDNHQRVPAMLNIDCNHMMNCLAGYVGLLPDNPQHNTAVPNDMLHQGKHFHNIPKAFICIHH
jgi:hypothetical protein